MSQRKYLVVFNPVANRARKRRLDKLVAFLKANDLHWHLYPTDLCLSANQHYFEQNLEHYTDVIVVGGDGTLHNVVNCLGESTHIRLGLVPAGTGNDFAQWVYGKKKNDLAHVLSVVTGDSCSTISLGLCEFADGSRRVFHNVLGLGFDAMLAKELTDNKGMFGSLGYLIKSVQTLPFFSAGTLTLREGHKSKTYENLITAFANAPYFGGGMKIAPKANAELASLDMCRIEMLPKLTMFVQILRLLNGSHIKQSFTDYRTLEGSMEIESTGADIQADGEYIGQSPCRISTLPKALKIKR